MHLHFGPSVWGRTRTVEVGSPRGRPNPTSTELGPTSSPVRSCGPSLPCTTYSFACHSSPSLNVRMRFRGRPLSKTLLESAWTCLRRGWKPLQLLDNENAIRAQKCRLLQDLGYSCLLRSSRPPYSNSLRALVSTERIFCFISCGRRSATKRASHTSFTRSKNQIWLTRINSRAQERTRGKIESTE